MWLRHRGLESVPLRQYCRKCRTWDSRPDGWRFPRSERFCKGCGTRMRRGPRRGLWALFASLVLPSCPRCRQVKTWQECRYEIGVQELCDDCPATVPRELGPGHEFEDEWFRVGWLPRVASWLLCWRRGEAEQRRWFKRRARIPGCPACTTRHPVKVKDESKYTCGNGHSFTVSMCEYVEDEGFSVNLRFIRGTQRGSDHSSLKFKYTDCEKCGAKFSDLSMVDRTRIGCLACRKE